MRALLLVALGGMVGSVARYLAQRAVGRWLPGALPWGTLAVNVSGSLLIGLLLGLLPKDTPTGEAGRWLLVTGFCGGFTTFSTFSAETLALLHHGDGLVAVSYALGSVVLGLVAVWLGLAVARALMS